MDRKALILGAVNPTGSAVDLSISLFGERISGKARTWIITGSDPRAYNEPDKPRRITIDQTTTDLIETLTVKPLSITMFKAAI